MKAEWVTWKDMGSRNYGTKLAMISGPGSRGCTQVLGFFLVCLFIWFCGPHSDTWNSAS